MFTIFDEEHEPLSERAKVDKLLSKVQSSGLSAAVAQLRYQLNTTGITFTVAANHLNYQLSRRINATNTTSRGGHHGGGRGDGRGDGCGSQGRGVGRGRGGRSGRGSTPQKTTYYSTTEWESFHTRSVIVSEKNAIRKQSKVDRSVLFPR